MCGRLARARGACSRALLDEAAQWLPSPAVAPVTGGNKRMCARFPIEEVIFWIASFWIDDSIVASGFVLL